MQEDWVDRYEHRVEDYRLPAGKQACEDYAVVRGKDGANLLSALYAAEAPAWLAEIPAVETLRRVWVQHFYWEQGELCWRDASNVPAAGHCIDSPSDPEAHYAPKRTTSWVGYKVHLTETCDDDSPHLLTHVETTPAPLADDAAVPLMHEALAAHDLLPGVHLVDTGYGDAEELVSSQQQYGVDLFGPTSSSWIGRIRMPSVRRDRKVTVGRPPRIGVATQSSKSSSRCRIVVPAQAESSVPTVSRPLPVACSPCARRNSIRPCRPHANGKQQRHSKPRMLRAPALRGCFHKAFVPSDYGRRAIEAKPKCICSTSSRPPRSISAAGMPGSRSNRVLTHGKRRSFDS